MWTTFLRLKHTGQKSRLQDSELWELLKKNLKKIGIIVGAFEKKIEIVGSYLEIMPTYLKFYDSVDSNPVEIG
jgi:hypothetical protein